MDNRKQHKTRVGGFITNLIKSHNERFDTIETKMVELEKIKLSY